MRDYRLHLCLALVLALFLALNACGGSGGGDDQNDAVNDPAEDPAEETPETYIITSGYGDQFFVFSGDSYSMLKKVVPDLTEEMTGVFDATLVSFLGDDDFYTVFMTLPQDEYGNAQMFASAGLTGEELMRLTDIDNPGMGRMVPTGSDGLLFIAVEAGTLADVMKMDIMGSEPSSLDLVPPNLPSGAYPCLTTSWQSPAFSPAGELKAFGYHCKVQEGPELPSKTAVVAYDRDDDSCGDPLYVVEHYENIEDVCFTYDASMVLYSIGQHAATKRIYARMANGEDDEAVELTSAFNDGEILNFDCDPSTGRIVFNDREVNPNLYVLEYEIGESIIITAAAEQISEGGTFRRPRWVKNPAFGNE